ncbi:hypothetical protein LINPERHAP2_LOCUS26579 [Linum perenne]
MQEDCVLNPRCPKVVFSEDELKSFYRPWSKALVVKVLERSFSFGAVKRRLESLWARNGSIQVSDVANSYFLVRFSDPDDYQGAAFGGPWKIYDYYFSVARWTPDFNEDEPLKTILTWVRLPRLPIQYFNRVAVSHIGNCIGRTVKLDLATSEGARARYARVCVEVDVSKPLLGKYMIENRTFFVEYESLENICATCGFYGHKTDSCTQSKPVDTPISEPTSEETSKSQEGDAGDWMVVQRRNKSKGMKNKQEQLKTPPSGSRFTPLTGNEDTQSKVTASPSGTDFSTAALAASLAAELSKAPHLQMSAGHTFENATKKPNPRAPLAIITNEVNRDKASTDVTPVKTLSSSKSNKLVNVPVVYDNPMFLGKAAANNTSKPKKQVSKRDKVVVRRDRPSHSEKGARKDGKQIRTFTSRQGPAKENINSEDGVKVGEPPDRS